MPMHDFTPNFDDLAEMVTLSAPLASSSAHGTSHWRAVTRSGLLLASHDPSVDAGLVLLFGLLHDSRRENDMDDPEHGPRAELYMRELIERRVLTISDSRARVLGMAMRLHDAGLTSLDPTIGACWDADRLQLQRFGYDLDPERLSTRAARTSGVQDQTRDWHFDDALGWRQLGEIAHDFARRSQIA
jgi:uncharacterized protein